MLFRLLDHKYASCQLYFPSLIPPRTDDTAGFFKLSDLHYRLGEAEESLNEVRECLRLDPEHKECYPFYKRVKKVAKFVTAAQEAQNEQRWDECVEAANKVGKTSLLQSCFIDV